MCAGYQDWQQRLSPPIEETGQVVQIVVAERCESRRRGALMPEEGGRASQYEKGPVEELALLLPCVFHESIRRVSDDAVAGTRELAS